MEFLAVLFVLTFIFALSIYDSEYIRDYETSDFLIIPYPIYLNLYSQSQPSQLHQPSFGFALHIYQS